MVSKGKMQHFSQPLPDGGDILNMLHLDSHPLEAIMKKLPKGIFVQGGALYLSINTKKWGRVRPVIAPNGISLKATPENIKYAKRFRDTVRQALAAEKMGGPAFDPEQFFPGSLVFARRLGPKDRVPTMAEVLTKWVERTDKKRAATTISQVHSARDEFIERWGTMAVTELAVGDIIGWIDDSQTRLKRTLKTVRNRLRVLRGALAHAVIEGVIPFSPVTKIDWSEFGPTHDQRLDDQEDEMDPFDLDEIEAILAHAGAYETIIAFWFGTGARPNEIFGLAWEDFNASRQSLTVRYGIVEGGVTALKTKGSRRVLDLNQLPMAQAAIQRQKAATFMLAPFEFDRIGPRRLIFPNPVSGQPYWHHANFGKVWATILRKAGVRYRYPYQMRHTFASLAIEAGESESWIAGILGHVNTTMVRERYAKNARPELIRSVGGERFNKLWSKPHGVPKVASR